MSTSRKLNEPLPQPTGPTEEPTDSNPVPLSPTDPNRRTSDGDTGPKDQAADGGVPAIVAQSTQGNGSGLGGVGTPAIPILAPGGPTADDDVLRHDSEGAV